MFIPTQDLIKKILMIHWISLRNYAFMQLISVRKYTLCKGSHSENNYSFMQRISLRKYTFLDLVDKTDSHVRDLIQKICSHAIDVFVNNYIHSCNGSGREYCRIIQVFTLKQFVHGTVYVYLRFLVLRAISRRSQSTSGERVSPTRGTGGSVGQRKVGHCL